MAYDETLADRVRSVLADIADLREQKMFGGIAFIVPEGRDHAEVGYRAALTKLSALVAP